MKKNVNLNDFCSSSRTNITECAYKSWAGNGYCDDPVNTAECGYDLGDCCPGVNISLFASKMRGNNFKKLAFLGRVFVFSYRNWDQRDKNYKIQGKFDKNTTRICNKM